MKKSLFNYIKVLSLVMFFSLFLGWAVVSAQSWTPPAGSPPANNTPAPINVSNILQSKEGSLKITKGGFYSWGPALFNDVVVIGGLSSLSENEINNIIQDNDPNQTTNQQPGQGTSTTVIFNNQKENIFSKLSKFLGLETEKVLAQTTPTPTNKLIVTGNSKLKGDVLVDNRVFVFNLATKSIPSSGVILNEAPYRPVCVDPYGQLRLCSDEPIVGPSQQFEEIIKVCVGYKSGTRKASANSGVTASRSSCINWVKQQFVGTSNSLLTYALGCGSLSNLNKPPVVEGSPELVSSSASNPPAQDCGWGQYQYTQTSFPVNYTSPGTSKLILTGQKTLKISVWGAGGGGGGKQGSVHAAGGGGGGFSQGIFTLGVGATPTSPMIYDIKVGEGGKGGNSSTLNCNSVSPGEDGGQSYVGGSNLIWANGGKGGSKNCDAGLESGGVGGDANGERKWNYSSWQCPAVIPNSIDPISTTLKAYPGQNGCTDYTGGLIANQGNTSPGAGGYGAHDNFQSADGNHGRVYISE